MILTYISVGCPREHDGYDPSYIREFHINIMLVRDSCIRCKGTVGRMFPGMICHELSLVVLLHMRPSQARRLENMGKSFVSPS